MIPNGGEIAALATAMCFSVSSIFFTTAGRKFGPMVSNRLRLIIAIILLVITHWITFGSPFPFKAGIERWFWLGVSGIVGLAIGDLFLFQAYILIGPRLGLLFLSLSPAVASTLAWFFLGEVLSFGKVLGIILTLAGIAWVVLESNTNKQSYKGDVTRSTGKISFQGVLAGIFAATGQAVGIVLAKVGLKGSFSPISGNVIRMTAAFIALWLVTIIQGEAVSTIQRANNQRSGLLYLLVGAIFGPLIGVSLSLYAIQNTDIGIASTLIALPPIFLLPVGVFLYKEHITWKATLGTIIAIAGVGFLFWL
jgi:drug/metabolite transporter (DMT)-like permease